ncbi:MAG: GNAT family N-acetyltransferase [Gammaproteobacteria bacterium]|nr:GNAT family N-acetyltransferase [Gammaproteobacteria bacterium]
MEAQPELHSPRLILRAFNTNDAAQVQALAGDERIADTTAHIPHPYPADAAINWISTHANAWQTGEAVVYAIILNAGQTLIGAISIIRIHQQQAEIGYWIGVPFWGKGYATEALQTIIKFAFKQLRLKRLSANYLQRNPASGRVLTKAGMQCCGEGKLDCGYRHENEPVYFYEISSKELHNETA